jgi:hypothetical protein
VAARQGTTAHHSEKSDDFLGREDDLVKGMSSRHSGGSAAIRWYYDTPEKRLRFQGSGAAKISKVGLRHLAIHAL